MIFPKSQNLGVSQGRGGGVVTFCGGGGRLCWGSKHNVFKFQIVSKSEQLSIEKINFEFWYAILDQGAGISTNTTR